MSVSVDDVLAAAAELQREGGRRRRATPEVLAEVVERFENDESQADICRALNLHRTTVMRHLQKVGLVEKRGKVGAPERDRCARGHSMLAWGKKRAKGDGRYCSRCSSMTPEERRAFDAGEIESESTPAPVEVEPLLWSGDQA